MSDIYSDFKGKVGVVTGGGSGIGRAAALLLAKHGCKVLITERKEERLQDALKEIKSFGGEGLCVTADVSQEEDIKKLYDVVKSQWGRVDYVIANAGINGTWAPIEDLSVEEYDRTMNINLRGTFLTIKYAIPLMKSHGDGGSIVVVSSINGTRTFCNTGATAYSASKAGQVAIAKMLALELAKDRIRVNAVCPGYIETNISQSTHQKNLDNITLPAIYPKGVVPLTGGKKGGAAEQVARTIRFLCSSESDHITGTELWIDGAESLFAK